MVTTRKAPVSDANEDGAGIFIAQLAKLLQERSIKTWKAKQISSALEKAVSSLPDGSLKQTITNNMDTHASQLHKLLATDPTPTTKKAAATAAVQGTPAAKKPRVTNQKASTSTPAPATLADDSLQQAVQPALDKGQLDASIDVLAPLLARFLPPEGYTTWLIQHLHTKHNKRSSASTGTGTGTGDTVAELETALQLCNAVAGNASTPEAALAVFSPAVTLLAAAVEAKGNDGKLVFKQLQQITTRMLFCMQTAALEVTVASQRPVGSEGKHWLEWNEPQLTYKQVLQQAESVCCSIITLKIKIALHLAAADTNTSQHRNGAASYLADDSLASAIARDMQQLGPLAIISCLCNIAEIDVAAVLSSQLQDKGIRSLLTLHAATLKVALQDNISTYLASILSARKVSEIFGKSPVNQIKLSAVVLEDAALLTTPPSTHTWLQRQPPSAIVLAAIAAMKQGPTNLSHHLVYVAKDSTVKALLAAARAAGSGVDVEGVDAAASALQEAAEHDDDLLFFVSTEGDRTAFGRDWKGDGEQEEQDGDGGQRAGGLRLEDLPDAGKIMKENPLYDDEEQEYDVSDED